VEEADLGLEPVTADIEDPGVGRPSKRLRSPSPELLAAPLAQSHRNKKRAKRRREKAEQKGHQASERTLLEHVQLADPISASLQAAALPADSSGYGALRLKESMEEKEQQYTLADLQALGFQYIEWDGKCVDNS
jgi:hypothetical protein